MKKLNIILIIIIFIYAFSPIFIFAQTKDLLSPEETLWLKERNNTIVVYPEHNDPPYSYQNPAGGIQGLSIDYLELIAEKVGAKVQYLTPRSRSQINTDIIQGKGDVAFITPDKEKENLLIFTESYATVPVVIVVRKDFEKRNSLTLNDFNGKRVSMVDGSTVEDYVSKNYPRVVRDGVTDDEVSLQQVVLGEVDAAVMDVASLSFYLSKQVLSSVKIAGNTGLDYKPAFAMTKDKTTLQSILEKGLSQISTSDRALLSDKWIALPNEVQNNPSFFNMIRDNLAIAILYVLFAIGISVVIVLLLKRNNFRSWRHRKIEQVEELKEEFSELEGESSLLTNELLKIKSEEEKLKEKIKSLE